MKTLIAVSAIAASLAVPAFADTAFAVRHFNQDIDSVTELATVPAPAQGVTVSTNSRSALSEAYKLFNASVDSQGELRGVNAATVWQSQPSGEAAEIFADLRAESLENE